MKIELKLNMRLEKLYCQKHGIDKWLAKWVTLKV